MLYSAASSSTPPPGLSSRRSRLAWWGAAVGAFGVVAAAAGSVGATADESSGSPADVGSEPVVAAVLSGSIDDGGRSQALAVSLERLRLDGAIAELHFIPETSIDTAVGDGADLVVVEGSERGEVVASAAEEHAEVAIAWATATDADSFDELVDRPNVAVITAAADQGGYVFGEVAAALADGGPATLFRATDTGTDLLFGEGFAAGFAAAGGADVVDEVVDGEVDRVEIDATAVAAGSVREAVEAAVAEEVPFFYDGYDLTGNAETVVASLVYRYDPAFEAIVGSLADGSFDAGHFELDLANEGIALVFNEAFDLDEAILDAAGDTFARIELGMIRTDGSPAPSQSDQPTQNDQPAQSNRSSGDDSQSAPAQASQDTRAPETTQAPDTTQAPETTQPATTQPATTQPSGGSCQGMGRGPANEWRAALGRAPLSGTSLGSCSWARQLAANGSLSHGASWEVVYFGPSCGGAWSAWRNSEPHYNIIVEPSLTAADFQCYVDGNGTAWAVGRLS